MERWLQKQWNRSSLAADGKYSMFGSLDTIGGHSGEDLSQVDYEVILTRDNVQPRTILFFHLHDSICDPLCENPTKRGKINYSL